MMFRYIPNSKLGQLSQLAKAFREGFVFSGEYSDYRRRRYGNSSRTAAAQDGDPDSTLNLYRRALSVRATTWVQSGDMEWIPTAPEVAAFRRGDAQCWVNTGDRAVELPTDATVVLASVPGTTTELPPDAAVWLVAD